MTRTRLRGESLLLLLRWREGVAPAVELYWFLNCYCVTISTMLVSDRESFGGDVARWVLMRPLK